jgi:hypothetical protein
VKKYENLKGCILAQVVIVKLNFLYLQQNGHNSEEILFIRGFKLAFSKCYSEFNVRTR